MIQFLGLIVAILIYKFLPRTKKILFKAKPYGYGWYAASWEGWIITLAFVAAAVLAYTRSDTLINFIPNLADLILILFAIAYRTGEKLAWRWGNKKTYE